MADQHELLAETVIWAEQCDLWRILPHGSFRIDCCRSLCTTDVSERHRHRYEVNNAYRDRLNRQV